MTLLKVLWAILKAGLYVVGAIFDGLSSSGRQANRRSFRHQEPPSRQRTSAYYSGPGHRP